jgi:hypothetical protein
MNRIALCILSRAAGGTYVDRHGRAATVCHHQDCPLDLTQGEAVRCPCKTRVDVGEVQNRRRQPVPVQVIQCCFPNTWNGDVIRHPKAFARSLRNRP